jgi:hypothetical protein
MKKNIILLTILISFKSVFSQWSEIGGVNGFSGTWSNGKISAFDVSPFSNNLWVGGDFGNSGSGTREISRYISSSNSWNQAGTFGANGEILTINYNKGLGTFLVGGIFRDNNGDAYVSHFDLNGNWTKLGNSIGDGVIFDIISDKFNNIYCAGPENSNGNVFVAKYQSGSWVELGGANSLASVLGQSTQQIFTICSDNSGNIYAAGNLYATSGGSRIAKFNGSSWSLLNISFNGDIQSIKTDSQGNLYVAGNFTNSNGNRLVVKYDGTTWAELGGNNSLKANSQITTIFVDKKGGVYAGGVFTNGSSNKYIAYFDGNNWSELGGNNSLAANGNINVIKSDTSGNILVAGTFKNSNGNFYVAKYTCTIPTPTISPNGIVKLCQGQTISLTSSANFGNKWNNGDTSKSINVNSQGSYKVTVSFGGCSVSSSVTTVNIVSSPVVNLSPIGNCGLISINAQTQTLFGNPSGGVYNGLGVSNNNFNPSNGKLGLNKISYVYTNTDGCKGTAIANVIVYDTTGQYCSVEDTLKIKMIKTVNNSIEINIVKIYPNPAKDKVFIDVGDINFQSGNSITITNAVGQEIYANAITEKLTQIDISNWNSNGIYIFKIKDSLGAILANRKILIQ